MVVIAGSKTEEFLEEAQKNLRTVSNLIQAGEMRIKNSSIEMDLGVTFKTIYGDNATITIADYPKQGSRTPIHCHKDSKEVLICILGEIIVSFGKISRTLRPGDIATLDKSQPHSCTAISDRTRLIAICVPEEQDYKRSMPDVPEIEHNQE